MSPGLILRLPIWDQPRGEQIFDDEDYWLMPVVTSETRHVTSDSAAVPITTDAHADKKSIELSQSSQSAVNGINYKAFNF
jgi:hypothetical protein